MSHMTKAAKGKKAAPAAVKAVEKAEPAVRLPRMKLGIVADPHVGNRAAFGGKMDAGLNERGRLSVEVLRRSLALARERGVTLFVVAGDLFHSRRPEPAEIAAVQRALAEAGDLGVMLVPGNHDMLDATAEQGNTACEPLWHEATVVRGPTWLEDPNKEMDVLFVPFHAAKDMRSHLHDLARENWAATDAGPKRSLARVLVVHVGVYDDSAPAWAKEATDGVHKDFLFDLMALGSFDVAFVGNYHRHATWTRGAMTIMQVGTLCPGGFSDEGLALRGLLATYMLPATLDLVEVPGLRFVHLAAGGDLSPEDVADGCEYHVRKERSPNLPADADPETVRAHLKLASFEWVEARTAPDAAEPEEKGPTEAEDAEKAITEYVAKMKLPEGVLPGDVLEQVREAWRVS